MEKIDLHNKSKEELEALLAKEMRADEADALREEKLSKAVVTRKEAVQKKATKEYARKNPKNKTANMVSNLREMGRKQPQQAPREVESEEEFLQPLNVNEATEGSKLSWKEGAGAIAGREGMLMGEMTGQPDMVQTQAEREQATGTARAALENIYAQATAQAKKVSFTEGMRAVAGREAQGFNLPPQQEAQQFPQARSFNIKEKIARFFNGTSKYFTEGAKAVAGRESMTLGEMTGQPDSPKAQKIEAAPAQQEVSVNAITDLRNTILEALRIENEQSKGKENNFAIQGKLSALDNSIAEQAQALNFTRAEITALVAEIAASNNLNFTLVKEIQVTNLDTAIAERETAAQTLEKEIADIDALIAAKEAEQALQPVEENPDRSRLVMRKSEAKKLTSEYVPSGVSMNDLFIENQQPTLEETNEEFFAEAKEGERLSFSSWLTHLANKNPQASKPEVLDTTPAPKGTVYEPKAEVIPEPKPSVVTDEIFEKFTDTNEVPYSVYVGIAQKILNNENLSPEEIAIYGAPATPGKPKHSDEIEKLVNLGDEPVAAEVVEEAVEQKEVIPALEEAAIIGKKALKRIAQLDRTLERNEFAVDNGKFTSQFNNERRVVYVKLDNNGNFVRMGHTNADGSRLEYTMTAKKLKQKNYLDLISKAQAKRKAVLLEKENILNSHTSIEKRIKEEGTDGLNKEITEAYALVPNKRAPVLTSAATFDTFIREHNAELPVIKTIIETKQDIAHIKNLITWAQGDITQATVSQNNVREILKLIRSVKLDSKEPAKTYASTQEIEAALLLPANKRDIIKKLTLKINELERGLVRTINTVKDAPITPPEINNGNEEDGDDDEPTSEDDNSVFEQQEVA